MADPISAAVATATPAVLDFLEDKLNAPIRRHNLASDNRERLQLLEQLLEQHLRLVDGWMREAVDEDSSPHRLLTWRTRLQHAKEKCTQLSPKVESATQFNRVQRADQVLAQVESTEKEFAEFAAVEERERTKALDAGEPAPQMEAKFRTSGTVPSNPPRLTLDYDSQDTFEGELKAAILERSTHKVLAVVAAGRGGVGKTCALRGLNDVDDVRSRFPDGVQFMRLGKDAGIDILIQEIARIVNATGNETLGRDIRRVKLLQTAVDKAKVWFVDHQCLFLVDDVWKANGFDVQTFYVLADMINADSRLVYTTRENDLAIKADKYIEFKPRKAKESRAMFLKHSGLEHCVIGKKANTEALEGILKACGGIPLLLAVTGLGVREYFSSVKGPKEDALKLYHDKLRREPDAMIKGEMEGYGLVRNVTDTSISVLNLRWEERKKKEEFPMSIREMHQSLCVLQKQQEVPASMLRRLWSLSDERKALEAMRALNSVGVVDVTIPENEGELSSVLRVHDDIIDALFYDSTNEKKRHFNRLLDNYLRDSGGAVDAERNMISVNADEREGRGIGPWLNLKRLCCWISNDREGEIVDETAVADCTTERKKREWWTLADEQHYLENNVCRLLYEAGNYEELIWLLLKPQWIVKRLQTGGIFALENDISRGKQAIDCCDMETKEEKKRAMDLISQAARLSHQAVAENPREATFQLYGRLIWYSEKCETARRFVEEIEEIAEKPWAKARKGFLSAAGDAILESISVGGKVERIVEKENELWVLCWRPGKKLQQIVKYNLKYGNQTKVEIEGKFGEAAMYNDFQIDMCMCGDRFMECTTSSEDLRWGASVFPEHGTVIVWDRQHVHEPRKLVTGRKEKVCCVALSAIRKKLVCGLADGTIYVWDLESGDAIFEALQGHRSSVRCLALSENGDMIASGSSDGSIRLWNTESGRCFGVVEIGNDVGSVAFAKGGKRVLWSAIGGEYGFSEHANGRVVTTVVGVNTNKITTFLGSSKDGSVGFFGFTDGTVRLWDLRRAQSEMDDREEGGHEKKIHCAEVSADGSWIATGSDDFTIRLWDGETGTLQPQVLRGHTNEVTSVSFSEDGRRLLSESSDGTIRVWEVPSGRAVCDALRLHGDILTSLAICADGTRAASGHVDGVVCVWDTQRGVAVCELLSDSLLVTSLTMCADGSRVAAIYAFETLLVWDVQARVATHQFSVPNDMRLTSLGSAGAVFWDQGRTAFLYRLEDSSFVPHPEPPRAPAPRHLRKLEFGEEQHHMVLGTAEVECRPCKLGFFFKEGKRLRFCQVVQ